MHYRMLWAGAMTGLALHLAGLGWDVYRHSHDATLAQREDVLSLTNPSHLMIVGGTALMAAALFGIAVAWMQERRIGGEGTAGVFLRAAGLPVVGIAAAGAIWLASQANTDTHVHDFPHDHASATDGLVRSPDHAGVPESAHSHPASTDEAAAMGEGSAHHHHAEVPVTAEQLLAASQFVAKLEGSLQPYEDVRAAMADGYIQITQDLPGIAAHFLRPDYLRDGRQMDPEHPEVLLYTKRLDGSWRLVGAMFLAEGVTEEPPSYFGPLDAWHYHENLCFVGSAVRVTSSQAECPGLFTARTPWQLHVWTVPTTGGVFAHDMPEISPGAYPGAVLPAAQELRAQAR
ncbi:hypothetical protein [Tepidiforma sp.]|uniref:hypothetical protein n=1 Tax=Tepidiforma sp. TaxID=2682230 RepID=UPI002ADDCCD1|nr:hypothetical protein [Tepidiforma sp.]